MDKEIRDTVLELCYHIYLPLLEKSQRTRLDDGEAETAGKCELVISEMIFIDARERDAAKD